MNAKKLKILLLVLCSSYVTFLHAQTTITGRVTYRDGSPIVNASIKLRDSARGLIKQFTLSDAEGNFKMTPANVSMSHLLECSFVGYRTHSYTFMVEANKPQTIKHDIVLLQDTVELQEIHVRAITPIKVSGDTTTFRVDAFKQGNESSVGDLLNNVPGFSVDGGKITYNGRAVSRVLVEGDDLFGRDYATLTQNLGPRGIEKIELIDNYKDKTYLSTRLQKGNELVVNLKFDKKFLYRVMGSHEMGEDAGLAYYKVRENIVSLIPKLKFVTTANVNNTGVLGSEISGDMPAVPALAAFKTDGISFDRHPGYNVSPIAQLPDITTAVVPKNKLVFNNTQFISNNLLYKPSNKLLIKNIIRYYNDNYQQFRSRNEYYSFPGNTLTVYNNQHLHKKLPFFDIANEVVYNITPRIQLVYKLNSQRSSENDSSIELKQNVLPTNNSLNINTRSFRQQLDLSALMDSSLLANVRAFHADMSTRQLPSVYPSNIFESLTGDSSFQTIHSAITDRYREYALEGSLAYKKRKSTYSLKTVYVNGYSYLDSEAGLYDSTGRSSIPPGFVNGASLHTVTGSVELSVLQILSKQLNLQIAQKLETGNLLLANGSQNSQAQYGNYLPSTELSFHINRKHTLRLGWAVQNRLPAIQDLFFNQIVASAEQVVKGVPDLRMGTSQRTTLSYIYSDPARQRLSAYAALAYAREPLLYLLNTVPGALFTINNSMAFQGEGTTLNFLGSFSKYFSSLKSQFAFDINAYRHNNYYSVNNLTGPFTLNDIEPRVKVKTIITDGLISTVGWQGAFVSQQSDKGFATSRTQIGQTNNWLIGASYKLSKVLLFTGRYQQVVQSYATAQNRLGLCDASLIYTMEKQKLRLELSANNIFSPGNFTTTSYTPLSTITQAVNIFPAYVMLQVKFDW